MGSGLKDIRMLVVDEVETNSLERNNHINRCGFSFVDIVVQKTRHVDSLAEGGAGGGQQNHAAGVVLLHLVKSVSQLTQNLKQ